MADLEIILGEPRHMHRIEQKLDALLELVAEQGANMIDFTQLSADVDAISASVTALVAAEQSHGGDAATIADLTAQVQTLTDQAAATAQADADAEAAAQVTIADLQARLEAANAAASVPAETPTNSVP